MQWRIDVGWGLKKIGEVLRAQGDLTAALAVYRDGLDIMRALAAEDPGNTGWQRELAVSLDRVGNVLVAEGDLPGALVA